MFPLARLFPAIFPSERRQLSIMKAVLGISLLPLLAASSPVYSVGTIHKDAAPVVSSVDSKVIPDSYMIVFKDHVTKDAAASHHGWVQDLHASAQLQRTELRKRSQLPFVSDVYRGLKHTYNIAGSVLGYSGHFDEGVLEEIRRHPDVSAQAAASPLLSDLALTHLGCIHRKRFRGPHIVR